MSPSVLIDDNSAVSDSDDDDNTIDIPSKPMKKRKKRPNFSIVIVDDDVMKIELADIPTSAKQVIKTIVDCKSLAKYIKKVSDFECPCLFDI